MRLVVASLIAAVVAATPVAADAGRAHPPAPARPIKVAGRQCVVAGRAVVDTAVGFDSVRVVVADAAPGAAVEVTVLAGTADRRVRAWGGGAWSLTMDPTTPGPVLVAVEPPLDAPAGACVERVELLRDARVIADVRVH